MESLNSQRVTICVLGKTGGGKSTFLNTILKEEKFKQSSSKESCTSSISKWECTAFGQRCLLIDVPGYKDSQNRDQEFLDEMLKKIKEVAKVNLFVFVFSSTERLSADQLEALVAYRQLLGIENRCWDHVAVAYTRCDYNSDDYESLDDYLSYLAEQETAFKEAFRAKFQCEINVFAFGLKQKRKDINNQAIELKMAKLLLLARNLTYQTHEMKRAFSKDFLIDIRQKMDSNKEQLIREINAYISPENQRPRLLEIVQSSCTKLRKDNKYLSEDNYVQAVIVESFEQIKLQLSKKLKDIVGERIEALKNQITIVVRESAQLGSMEDFNLEERENTARQIIAGAAGGLALGVAISVATDMVLVGGASAYLALVSSGGIAALGLSAAAYTALTVGTGLVVAGTVTGIVLLAKSGWSFGDANQKAVDELLRLMAKGRSDMILKIAEFWDAECREINNRLELYLCQEEAEVQ